MHFSCFFGILLGIHSKESPFFLLFGRDPLTPLSKLLSPKNRYPGDERGLFDVEAVRYALAIARKNMCLNRQRSDKDHTPTRFKDGDLVYIKNHTTSTWKPKWKSGFHLIKNSTSCSAILESTLNGKTRIVNIGDMQLADPVTVIEAEDIPPNRWGRKARLLFSEESLPDQNWPK